MRRALPLLICALGVAPLLHDLRASAQKGPAPGPTPKQLVGGPFLPTVVSGKRLNELREGVRKTIAKRLADSKLSPEQKDKVLKEALARYAEYPLSPITEFGTGPVVGIFINQMADTSKDKGVRALLERVEQAVKRYQDTGYLQAFAIFLSPKARSSATAGKAKDTEGLIEEALQRDELAKYVTKLVGDLKIENVVVGFLPYEELKGYHIPDQAEVTVLLYAKHVIHKRYDLPGGQLSATEVDRVLKGVADFMKEQRRRAKAKGPAAR
jgi:hypothetical protein